MIKDILSPQECAGCRQCCVFDRYDLRDTPVLPAEMAESLGELYPRLSFISFGNSRLFRMEESEDGLYRCPMLAENGCILGDSKPFDCRIWPYMVMDFRGRLVITAASACAVMYGRPLKRLIDELDTGLADIIFEEARKNPDIVREYRDDCPILRTGGFFTEM